MSATALGAVAQTPVERGSYLANTIMTCGNCHTPAGPNGMVLDRAYSGGPQVWDRPAFTVKGANITPDRETGIGSWSVDDIKKTLVSGVRPDGVPLAPIMPTAFYKVLTARDLDAIAAYLRSLKAVRNEVQTPTYKAAIQPTTFPGADKQMTEAELADPLKRGYYLGTIGHCLECHTPMVRDERDFQNRLGAGGEDFPGPWGVSTSRNITSHQTKGIGAWSNDEVKRAITQGVSRDGTKLKPPMGFALYAKMTDADLNALVTWVRTIPAKE